MQVVSAIQAFYTPISDGIYPEMIKNKDLGLIKKVIKWVVPVILVGCVFAYFLAGFGMVILGGEKYLEAVPIFRILIPVLFFGFLSVIFGWPTLGAIGKTKETTISTVVSVTVNIGLLIALILTDSFTLKNVAIVRCVTELVLFGTRFLFFVKYKHLFEEVSSK
jgi:PST family polysaccharide transporter